MLQTDDLFLGAFGLMRGGELREVVVRLIHGRPVAFFEIDAPGIDDVEREYFHGPCLVNLRLFKSEVARLKSIAFEALRKEESRHAAADHERGHRPGQGAELHRRGRR